MQEKGCFLRKKNENCTRTCVCQKKFVPLQPFFAQTGLDPEQDIS